MRILVISDLYPPVSFGGYELECRTVVDHLRDTHEVHVLTSDRGGAGEEDGVWRALPYSGTGRRPALLAPVHALRAQHVVRQALARARPELVFVWNAAAIPTAAVRIAVDHGAPVVHRLCERWFAQHLLLADHFLGRLATRDGGLRGAWGRVLRVANRHPRLRLDPRAPYAAALSWNSDALRTSVTVPAFVEPVLERTVHPATANAERFAALARRPTGRPSMIFVGRASQQKGADVAVRALGVLERTHGVRADLVFAGPCEPAMRARLRAQATAAGASGCLEFRGMLAPHALGGALQAAHVMVAPSAAEAFGLACVEAAAARVPVVASRVDGIPEALHEGEHALLFAPGDAEACAALVAEVLRDDEGTAARVERAFLRARELSVERYLARMDGFLADALAAFGARASR
ncbi:MAG: glycosyltransferase family 4 protein [Actinomycetota bacterium]|nr:glycosyltransferase family 4 protein [Actinomycetota bacterium]